MTKAVESKCCNMGVPVTEFVKSIVGYWPPQSWLLYKCQECSKQSHLTIQGDVVRFGYLDGAPSPSFILEYSQRIPGLKFTATKNCAFISYGSVKNNVKVFRHDGVLLDVE